MRALAAALLVTFATLRPAAADSPFARAAVEQGRQLADEAARAYKEGRFLSALETYRHAYDVAPAPELLFNIGQCHFQLKSYEWAIFFYQGYLTDRPRAANRQLVESLIAEARRHLRTRTVGSPMFTRVSLVEPAPAPRAGSPAFYRRWWFWTAIGVAAAAGGTAYWFYSSSSSSAMPVMSRGE